MPEPAQKQVGGRETLVFGPAPSWRLGRSLGIDLAPLKTCNWNCVYCQLGRTRPVQARRRSQPRAADVLSHLDGALTRLPGESFDWVTILGSGDPLLCSQLAEVIRGVEDRADKPLALLTNGALFMDPDVRRDVLECDVVLPSLSAGTPQLYKAVHRPHPAFSFRRHLDGLRELRREFAGPIWIEVMLVSGLNDSESHLTTLARRLRAIEPDEIHLNAPTRPPAEPWVRPPGPSTLARAADILSEVAPVRSPPEPGDKGRATRARKEGEEAVSGRSGTAGLLSPEGLASLLLRHPMTLEELVEAIGFTEEAVEEVKESLDALRREGRVSTVRRLGRTFWVPGRAFFPSEGARPPWVLRHRVADLPGRPPPPTHSPGEREAGGRTSSRDPQTRGRSGEATDE